MFKLLYYKMDIDATFTLFVYDQLFLWQFDLARTPSIEMDDCHRLIYIPLVVCSKLTINVYILMLCSLRISEEIRGMPLVNSVAVTTFITSQYGIALFFNFMEDRLSDMPSTYHIMNTTQSPGIVPVNNRTPLTIHTWYIYVASRLLKAQWSAVMARHYSSWLVCCFKLKPT